MLTCGTCKRNVPKDSMVQSLLQANRKICTGCHALKGRIQRLVKADDDGELEGLFDLNPETMTQLMKEGEKIYGSNLTAILRQAIVQSETESLKRTMAAQGAFEPLKDVEERMKDQPQALASLKANSRIITDPYFNVERIWVPNFSMSMTHEKESKVERKSKLEAEKTLKPPKRATTTRPPTTRPPTTRRDDDDQIELPESLVKRLETSKPKFEEELLEFNATVMEADAPDMAGHSPATMRQKAGDLVKEAHDTVKAMNKFLESKKGSKKTATEVLKTAKAQQQKMKEIKKQLRVFLDEAAAENAEEGLGEEEEK